MNLDFTEEQDLLRRTARGFLAKECDKPVVRELERSAKGYSPQMWRQFAEMGWLGLGLPEEYDGLGSSLVDLVVLYEEMGRALCPSPHLSTVVLCGSAIAEAGSPEQKQQLIPRIANGEAILAFALPESAGTWQADDVKTTAVPDGEGFLLNGTKLFVHWAEQADKLLVVTRTADSSDKREGVTLFVVDARAQGIGYTPMLSTAMDKQAEIVFKDVRVRREDMIGKLNHGWPVVERSVQKGLVALCAQMMGGCEYVLQSATEYAKVRVQFDHPIGSFQAIQHYLADTATEITGARTLAHKAAWTIDAGLDATLITAIAKAQVGDTFRRAVAVGHQIHAGIGYTLEGEMELYSRRAKAAQLSMGPSHVWEEVVAQQLGF